MAEKGKIGWTSSDFIREVEAKGRWTTKDVAQTPEEKFRALLVKANNVSSLANILKNANLQEFAIGYIVSDVNTQSRQMQEKMLNLMELKKMMAEREGASSSDMAKMRKQSAEKKLSYID